MVGVASKKLAVSPDDHIHAYHHATYHHHGGNLPPDHHHYHHHRHGYHQIDGEGLDVWCCSQKVGPGPICFLSATTILCNQSALQCNANTQFQYHSIPFNVVEIYH